MKPSGSWLRSTLGVAGTAVLVCALAFSQAAQTSTKPTTKPTTHPGAASKTKGKSTSSSSTHHTTKTKSTRSRTGTTHTSSRKGKRSRKVKGQEKIDAGRTQQIQEALIRQHYLTGEATGKWDAATEDALRRFQADNGWQNKTVPDSRALIKLGLGPSHDHLLNPESAMTTVPEAPPHSGASPASAPTTSGPSVPATQPQP